MTWSGNQIINETSGSVVDRKYPALQISNTGPLATTNTASEGADIIFTALTP